VVKEAITNAIKHAEAKHISIYIYQIEGMVCSEVVNDGNIRKTIIEGFGLKTMIERVEAIGGSLTYKKVQSEFPVFELKVYLPIVQEA